MDSRVWKSLAQMSVRMIVLFIFKASSAALCIPIWMRHSADDHIVEVAPIYDNPGETTALAAAEVVHSLLGLMVNKPVKP